MPLTAWRTFRKIMESKQQTPSPTEQPRRDILTEIRREAQKFYTANYKMPTKIVIHPMTLMEVIEAADQGQWSVDYKSEELGASKICGLEVEESLKTDYFFVQ